MQNPIYQLFTTNKTASVILILIIAALLCYIAVKVMQKIGTEKIRSAVYDAIALAEDRFQHGENTEKFEYVVNIAREAVPMPFSLFITEDLLRDVIQLWFDLVKNLLDSGRNYEEEEL